MKSLNLAPLLTRLMTLLLLVGSALSQPAHAIQGSTVLIPIAVGDITIFIPIMPSSSSGSVTGTTTDGSYNLTWSAVSNASYYQIIITDENGQQRIIKVTGTSYSLAGLSLGSNKIEIQACNVRHQCGVGYLAGTVSRSTKVTYQHTDMLGTPVLETDEAGQVASRSVYEPFGKRLGGEKAGIGYTGHLQDEDLGLTYMQARYYDPLIGRFYSNDPLPFRDVHSFNRYAYANNNPYKYKDPDGESPKELGSGGAKIALGVAVAMGTIDLDTAKEMSASVDGKPGKKRGSSNGKRAGKKHTRGAIKEAKKQNAAKNGGVVKCETCDVETTAGTQRTKGSTVNPNEGQGDHIQPRSKDGNGATVKDQSNIDIKCADCNNKKSDN